MSALVVATVSKEWMGNWDKVEARLQVVEISIVFSRYALIHVS